VTFSHPPLVHRRKYRPSPPYSANHLKYKHLAALASLLFLAGCRYQYYYQHATFVRPPLRDLKFSQDKNWVIFFKTHYFYPVRDLFDLPYQWSRITRKPLPARNLTPTGQVPDSSFFTNRPLAGVPADIIARGPNRSPPPVPPLQILKIRSLPPQAPSFFARDARGRRYLIKLDHPDYPELGTSAEIIASRIYHALGYFVPETHLILVQGTAHELFDGKRAVASQFVSDRILGLYKFDWVKDRREFRALKLAAMWLNDLDRSDNNNLAALDDDLVIFYLLDFNSALGSWQGLPKQPWQGLRYRWDVERQIHALLTLGLACLQPVPTYHALASDTLGYLRLDFDPPRWRPEKPNPAFDRLSPDDAAWMARKIARFSPAQLRAVIKQARLSDPHDEALLLEALLSRRKIILDYYLNPPENNN